MSSTEVQKQVGQTIVQLPHDRQRSATSSQRGCSRLRWSRSRMSVVSSVRPCSGGRPLARRAAPARSSGPAPRAGSRATIAGAARGARCATNRWPPSSRTSVSERSNPASARAAPGAHGDAEARAPRLPALDRDDERVLQARALAGVGGLAAEQHAVEHAHRMQLARAHAEERVAGRRLGSCSRRPRRRRCGSRAPAARPAAGGTPSRSAGRGCSRSTPRRRGGSGGKVPPSCSSVHPTGRSALERSSPWSIVPVVDGRPDDRVAVGAPAHHETRPARALQGDHVVRHSAKANEAGEARGAVVLRGRLRAKGGWRWTGAARP